MGKGGGMRREEVCAILSIPFFALPCRLNPAIRPTHLLGYIVIITVVTKISSCQVNTTRRWGNKQLGFSFSSIFLLFSFESSQEPHLY